ncbi:hypothetical protein DW646_20370 [Bacteroides sp. AM23-18]|jgi:vacuolar-type H+-ATPase subunit E/Vma4|uniref:hypothetical protein n=1 Tax=Bacteroides thetaiotaomicron TaxID=818 RepID=UPI000E3F7E92|nr:hypothetical protein DW646_20370 [Bacteroides sp. AM23-18]CAG9872648.1 hypothetical protein BOVAC2_4355 [Bacteroides ovatus]
MDRRKKHHYYKYIVKRHLNDIRVHIGQSKNEMERSYYRTRYAAQLSVYAEALGVQERILERFIQK